MLVSIITPSFNQAKYIERTILSVLDQDYPDIEYIIVDGGSTDSTIDIIKKYENKISYWVSEKDMGQTDAINKGFSKAHGEIIAWINSDDTYNPGAVSEAVNFLGQNPDVGLVYGDANFIDGEDCIIGSFPARQTSYKKLKQGYVHVTQQSAFFKKSVWDKVGPLDPSFYFAMDYDLWVRIAAVAPIVYISKLWANFRLHDDAKTIAADDRCWPEMLRVHRRDGGSWFSIIYAKYLIRKIVSPVINWRRKRMFNQ